jgi:4-hydroxy-3-methylbut-2-enyl diphosphate reductase
MITAHGTAERTIAAAERGGLQVLQATCPLVHAAHRALKDLVARGFHPVVIGKREHVEVRGMTGDLDDFDVVITEEDVRQLTARPRFGVVSQTTQPVERVQALVALLRHTFPDAEVEFRDTVCHPTKQRQQAAVELARECDVVVVVGGSHSNNTKELVSTSTRHCQHVYHIQTVADLRPEWLLNANVVGLTAGTSTPDHVIDEVERALRCIAAEQSMVIS